MYNNNSTYNDVINNQQPRGSTPISVSTRPFHLFSSGTPGTMSTSNIDLVCDITSVRSDFGYFKCWNETLAEDLQGSTPQLEKNFRLYLGQCDDISVRLFKSILRNEPKQGTKLSVKASFKEVLFGNACYSVSFLRIEQVPPLRGIGRIVWNCEIMEDCSPLMRNIMHGRLIGRIFYLGNNWAVTSAHNFDQESFIAAGVVFGNDIYPIAKAYAFLPPVGDELRDAHAEFMLVKLGGNMADVECATTVPWAPTHATDILLLAQIENASNPVYVSVTSVHNYKYATVFEIAFAADVSDARAAFDHGCSGGPLCLLDGTVGAIIIQRRGDSGYALMWNMELLKRVHQAIALGGVGNTSDMLKMGFQLLDPNVDNFSFLDDSEYRITFTKLGMVADWWKTVPPGTTYSAPVLQSQFVARGYVQNGKLTWVLPYKRTCATTLSENYLIVHIHPDNGCGESSMNFACELNTVPIPTQRSDDSDAAYQKTFSDWNPVEDRPKKKPAVTRPITGCSDWKVKNGAVPLPTAMMQRIEEDYAQELVRYENALKMASAAPVAKGTI